MTPGPLVSVLTPSFNQGRWLSDCLNSVRAQDYPWIEHIVMDGGSTDGSFDLLGSTEDRVRWWSEPDEGQSQALNKALARSRGEIIGWVNSDDAYFDSGAVRAAVRTFAQNPDAAVVYGHAVLVNVQGLLLHTMWVPRFSYASLRRYNFIRQPAAFIRRDVVEERFLDESFHFMMDRELWLRLGATHRFLRLDRILAIDRHQPDRKSYQLDPVPDERRLSARYGIPLSPVMRLYAKYRTASFRVRGMKLVPGVSRCELAFAGRKDGSWALARRQLGRRRVSMPA